MNSTKRAQLNMISCMVFDVLSGTLSIFLGMELRFWLDRVAPAPNNPPLMNTLILAALFSLCAFVVFHYMHIYRHVWRHVNLNDLIKIIHAVFFTNIAFLSIVFFSSPHLQFPRSSLGVEIPLWLSFLLISRLIVRGVATGDLLAVLGKIRPDAPRALLIGPADAVAHALKTARRATDGLPIRPIGILESRDAEAGRSIYGVPVLGGLSKLSQVMDEAYARYRELPWVAFAGLDQDRNAFERALEISASRGVKLIRLSSGEDIRFADIRASDLLCRAPLKSNTEAVKHLISGARVFVTGAGGTIGSELVRQIAHFNPSHISLFDSAEYNLYKIDLELNENYPSIKKRIILGDIRDEMRMRQVIQEERSDIVLHAAALKHVPLMELNPCEAVLTNVFGAQNVALAAVEAGVKSFVFISTDKAVAPVSVMGATKRLAESYLQNLARQSHQTRFSLVRFGNVIGSSGSVVPLFERQIARGGPVTVTHPEMTRYFMTAEEASSLVLQAACLNDLSGEAGLYVLDMGAPVRILDLAESIIRMNGFAPYRDIDIVFSGLRPGEKLHENVIYPGEAVSQTTVEGISRVLSNQTFNTIDTDELEHLIQIGKQRDRINALKYLKILTPGYKMEE